MTVIRTISAITIATAIGGGILLYYAFGAFLPWREDHEAERLADLAGIGPGAVVAEIGAGGGRFSLAFARRVGSSGRVFATELSPTAVAALEARAAAANLKNMTPVRADRLKTNLPDACCDVLVLRNVYHHVTDPDVFAGELRRAVRDGGRLVVADFEPGTLWFHGGRPDDATPRRPGHGVARAAATEELTAAGFVVEREFPQWSGPLWMVIFRAGPRS